LFFRSDANTIMLPRGGSPRSATSSVARGH
jgi:hypothetical protein